jgi:hypothetical protein
MINEQEQQLLSRYAEGDLAEAERQQAEVLLQTSEAARKWLADVSALNNSLRTMRQLQPSASLRQSFQLALQTEMERGKKIKHLFPAGPAAYRVAASLLLAAVTGLVLYSVHQNRKEELELAALRKELQEAKQMMISLMDNAQSASQRLSGVAVAYQLRTADTDVVMALVHVLNTDPNANVRLAALDALAKFADQPQVRKELAAALPHQTEPVVQIALIQWLVQNREHTIATELKKLIDDPNAMKAVKDEAHTALLKLS